MGERGSGSVTRMGMVHFFEPRGQGSFCPPAPINPRQFLESPC